MIFNMNISFNTEHPSSFTNQVPIPTGQDEEQDNHTFNTLDCQDTSKILNKSPLSQFGIMQQFAGTHRGKQSESITQGLFAHQKSPSSQASLKKGSAHEPADQQQNFFLVVKQSPAKNQPKKGVTQQVTIAEGIPVQKSNRKVHQKQKKKKVKAQFSSIQDQSSIAPGQGKVCRICLEREGPNSKKIIKPCECSISQSYVHQECLQQQLLDDFSYKVKDAYCKNCSYKFRMKLKYQRLYVPVFEFFQLVIRMEIEQRQDTPFCIDRVCDISVCFSYTFDNLIVSENSVGGDQKSQDFLESPISLMCFIIFAIIIEILVFLFIYLIMKNIFYVEKIYKWVIHDYVPPPIKQTVVMNQNFEIKDGKLQIKHPSVELQAVGEGDPVPSNNKLKDIPKTAPKKTRTAYMEDLYVKTSPGRTHRSKLHKSVRLPRSEGMNKSVIKRETNGPQQPSIFEQLRLQQKQESGHASDNEVIYEHQNSEMSENKTMTNLQLVGNQEEPRINPFFPSLNDEQIKQK